jgi:hypothetical protein
MRQEHGRRIVADGFRRSILTAAKSAGIIRSKKLPFVRLSEPPRPYLATLFHASLPQISAPPFSRALPFHAYLVHLSTESPPQISQPNLSSTPDLNAQSFASRGEKADRFTRWATINNSKSCLNKFDQEDGFSMTTSRFTNASEDCREKWKAQGAE